MSLRRRKQDEDEEWTPNYREKQEDDVEEEEFGNHSHHGLRKHPCKECANCLVKDCRKCVFCRFGFYISLVGFRQPLFPQRQGQIWWTQCQEAAVHLQRDVLEASGDNFLKKTFQMVPCKLSIRDLISKPVNRTILKCKNEHHLSHPLHELLCHS